MEFKNIGYRAVGWLEDHRPAKLRHSSWVLGERLSLSAMEGSCERLFMRRIKRLLLGFAVLSAMSAAAWFASPGLDDVLSRPAYGEGASSVLLDLQMGIDGQKKDTVLEVDVAESRLSKADADALFSRLWQELPSAMWEGDLSSVSGDLMLPGDFFDGRVDLFWESSSPSVLHEDGYIDFPAVSSGQSVELICTAAADGFEDKKVFRIGLDREKADMSGAFDRAASQLSEELSENRDGASLDLPSETGGITLDWKLSRSSPFVLVFFLSLMTGLTLYFSRYDSLERELKRLNSEFCAEIPNMSLQLILLLNAGLVASAAFEELVEQNRGSSNPLYVLLGEISARCRETNTPFGTELYRLARRSESREFIRFANLVYENSSRGSQLAEKLEMERNGMWNGRLSRARSRAKQAETKLCFPLLLLLSAVVLISISPAFLQMG